MAIILLVSVTAIACNMEKVVKEPTKENGEVVTTKNFNGKTVVIDPGHGGDDPGKIGVNKEKEKDVNLAISKKLFQVLNEQGYKVVLTRSEDVVLGDGVKFSKIRDLNKRCEIINVLWLVFTKTALRRRQFMEHKVFIFKGQSKASC